MKPKPKNLRMFRISLNFTLKKQPCWVKLFYKYNIKLPFRAGCQFFLEQTSSSLAFCWLNFYRLIADVSISLRLIYFVLQCFFIHTYKMYSIIYVRVISYTLKNKLNKNSTLQIYNFVYYSLSQLFLQKLLFIMFLKHYLPNIL